MEKITVQAIEAEIQDVLKQPLGIRSLETFVLLCRAKKYLMKMDCDFGEEEAKEWVVKMAPTAKWTMEQTTAVMRQKGYEHKPCEFWAVMNMLYSDYGKTLQKYNADKPEVWADMADAWITDPDVRPGKTARYYRDIVAE